MASPEARHLQSVVCAAEGGTELRIKEQGECKEVSCTGEQWRTVDQVLGAEAQGSREDRLDAIRTECIAVVGIPMLNSFVNGYNTCCFSFGQPVCGQDEVLKGDAQNPGLIRYITLQLLRQLSEAPHKQSNVQHVLQISLFEINQEGNAKDLLLPNNHSFKEYTVWQDPLRGPVLPQVTALLVKTATDFETEISPGLLGTAEGTVVFQATLYRAEGDVSSQRVTHQISTMRLVILSQQQNNPCWDALSTVADGLVEAQVNKDVDRAKLLQLRALVKENTLTYLMCESLGGNCVTTALGFIDATLVPKAARTLDFAERVRALTGTVRANYSDHDTAVTEIERQISQAEARNRKGSDLASVDWESNIQLRQEAIQMLERLGKLALGSAKDDDDQVFRNWDLKRDEASDPARGPPQSSEEAHLRTENEALSRRLQAVELENKRREGVDHLLAEAHAEILKLQSDLSMAHGQAPQASHSRQMKELETQLVEERREVRRLTKSIEELRQSEKGNEERTLKKWNRVNEEREQLHQEIDVKRQAMQSVLQEKVDENTTSKLELEAEIVALHKERRVLFKMLEDGKKQYDTLYRQLKRQSGWRPPGNSLALARRRMPKREKHGLTRSSSSSPSRIHVQPADVSSSSITPNPTPRTLVSATARSDVDEKLKLDTATAYKPRRKYSQWYYHSVIMRQRQAAQRLQRSARMLFPSFKPTTCESGTRSPRTTSPVRRSRVESDVPDYSTLNQTPPPPMFAPTTSRMPAASSSPHAPRSWNYNAIRYAGLGSEPPSTMYNHHTLNRGDVLVAKSALEHESPRSQHSAPRSKPLWRQELEEFERSLDLY
ncbi:Kinesin-related protein 1 [Diplonema papillatum]|nr:Kinesin-related protein 1 [Diplonema papillatum]